MANQPTISAFEKSPDRGQGLARDMIVRWALEEVGQSYKVNFMNFAAIKEPNHRSIHPFGKIPTYEDGDLKLFESGAIVLRIAETHTGLLPKDPNARSRAIMWMFAAVATLEPTIVEREAAVLVEKDKPWFESRRPMLEDRIRVRLTELSNYLGDSEWLEDEFSAGDIMMISALRRAKKADLFTEFPKLIAYVDRGMARPPFKKAFEDQLAAFRLNSN